MADYPTNLWIRDPVLEGKKIKGGGLNRAMELLGQARDEITAIETALGTDPAGSVATLLARLDVRHAKCGIPRGRVLYQPDPNAGWFDVLGTNVQIGVSGAVNSADFLVSFATSYTHAPSIIVAAFVLHESDLVLGEAQLKAGSLDTGGFHVLGKVFNAANAWVDPGASPLRYRVIYMAIGGD